MSNTWFHVFKKLDIDSLAFFDVFLAASKPFLEAKIIERRSGGSLKQLVWGDGKDFGVSETSAFGPSVKCRDETAESAFCP